MNNIILEKFRKANMDVLFQKAINMLTGSGYEYYAGIFYDIRFDEFFVGGFQTIIKYRNDGNILTLADYCVTDFFDQGFVSLQYYKKNKLVDDTYFAIRSTMYEDSLAAMKKYEATYADAA